MIFLQMLSDLLGLIRMRTEIEQFTKGSKV